MVESIVTAIRSSSQSLAAKLALGDRDAAPAGREFARLALVARTCPPDFVSLVCRNRFSAGVDLDSQLSAPFIRTTGSADGHAARLLCGQVAFLHE